MILTKETAEKCVRKCGGVKDWIVEKLCADGFAVVDDTNRETPMQWKLKIPNEDGTIIRISKDQRKKVDVQLVSPGL